MPEIDEQGRSVDVESSLQKLDKSERWHDVAGYKNFAEAARDVEGLMGVIWVSGTRRCRNSDNPYHVLTHHQPRYKYHT